MMLTIQPLGSIVDVSQFSVEQHFSVLGWVWADVLESITAVQSPTFRYILSADKTTQGIGVSLCFVSLNMTEKHLRSQLAHRINFAHCWHKYQL